MVTNIAMLLCSLRPLRFYSANSAVRIFAHGTIPGRVQLDAACGAGLPPPQEFARGISAGNGSPSAHTAPSSKYSFFQMGTVRLRVSMSQRQASKAAARCAEATAIKIGRAHV